MKRYDFDAIHNDDGSSEYGMYERDAGRYVTHAECAAELARLKEQRDFWIMAFFDERVARISTHSAEEEIAVEGFRIVDRKVKEIGNG